MRKDLGIKGVPSRVRGNLLGAEESQVSFPLLISAQARIRPNQFETCSPIFGVAQEGRGYLIIPVFSWQVVKAALSQLLMHASGRDWVEISGKLNKELHWEYDNYQP